MLREVLTEKWIIGACVVLIVVVFGGIFWFHHELAPYKKSADESAERHRQWEAAQKETEVNSTEVQTDGGATLVQSNTLKVEKFSGSEDNAGIIKTKIGLTSSNPMFADGVPKHLQFPNEWIGMYVQNFKEDYSELGRFSQPRIDEILSKYNPHRPITEVWPLFIDAEKYYYSNADPKYADNSQGAGRLDWMYQNILDFPEVFVLGNVDTDRFVDMHAVLVGNKEPDWNLWKLPDGREMRAATGYRYNVIHDRSHTNSKGKTYTSNSNMQFGHSGKNAKLITIYLSKTSDEELEQLGGWNYNVDPYSTGIYTLPEEATEHVLQMNRKAYGGLKK